MHPQISFQFAKTRHSKAVSPYQTQLCLYSSKIEFQTVGWLIFTLCLLEYSHEKWTICHVHESHFYIWCWLTLVCIYGLVLISKCISCVNFLYCTWHSLVLFKMPFFTFLRCHLKKSYPPKIIHLSEVNPVRHMYIWYWLAEIIYGLTDCKVKYTIILMKMIESC